MPEVIPETVDRSSPFATFPPVAGQPYKLGPLLPIKTGSPGYGCFMSPNVSAGLTLQDPSLPNVCAPGFYCPFIDAANPDTQMVMCPPSPECFVRRLNGLKTCLPQGRFEPVPCIAGFYCPNPKTILPCTEGHFCLTGTVTPLPCEFMSSCPVGSITQSHYGLVLIAMACNIALALVLFIRRLYELYRAGTPLLSILPDILYQICQKKQPVSVLKEPMNIESKPVVAMGDVDQLPAMVRQRTNSIVRTSADLVTAFRRGFNGKDNLHMNFTFKEMSLQLSNGKSILKGVSGSICSGRMTAIMGPSGAGKTTFMNVLMGKVNRTGGDLLINGVQSEMHTFRKIIGYVPQEDVMIRNLTVREIILHSARMRLPSTWTSDEINRHVALIMKALNLTRVAHVRIGDETSRGVSGGQRKRVNIGIELAAIPLTVFLDEPTSGLDSTSALDVADILSSISRLGLTIVCVIHQPRVEIFDKFDDVLMLVPGGRTAYFGPISAAKDYFTSLGFAFSPAANPADLFMDILAGRGVRLNQNTAHPTPSELVASFLAFDQSRNVNSEVADNDAIKAMAEIGKTRGAPYWKQIWHCHNRSLIQQSRLMSSLVLEIFCGILAGGVMGQSAGNFLEGFTGLLIEPYTLMSRAPSFWFIAMYGMLLGMSIALSAAPAGVQVFSEEKAVYWRETASGHSPGSYYIGKTISVLYRVGLSALHFAGVYCLMAPSSISVISQFWLLFLQFIVVYGVAAAVSMMVTRKMGALLAVIICLFMSVNSGFGITFTQARSYGMMWFFQLGPNRWAAEAQYGASVAAYGHIYDIASGIDGYVLGKFGTNCTVLVVLAISYRLLAYILMITMDKDKQK